MPDILAKIDGLAALARRESCAGIDGGLVVERLRLLGEEPDDFAFNVFAEFGAAAAAAAAVIVFFALSAWTDINTPLNSVITLFENFD